MKRIFLSLLLVFAAAAIQAAPAPTSASEVEFLQSVALRQYAQGDKDGAMKQFGNILRLDPNNAVAIEHLQKIASEAAAAPLPAAARVPRTITEIKDVKTSGETMARDAKDLEAVIRDLITENDALYQALYKRSREVIDMRSKFYGIPYGDTYAETMRGMPIDRVPQRLHRPGDILPEQKGQLTSTETREINEILSDIASLNEQRSEALLPDGNPYEVERIDAALRVRRDMLIDRTAALARKRDTLSQLRDEVALMNTDLKETDARYAAAAARMKEYYSRPSQPAPAAEAPAVEIPEETHKAAPAIKEQAPDAQEKFNALAKDYAAKVKELEDLKASIRTRDADLPSFKPALTAAQTQVQKIDTGMAQQDAELAAYKKELLAYKNELAAANAGLDALDRQVRSLETTLKEGDADMARLRQKLAKNPTETTPILIKNEKMLQETSAHVTFLEKELAAAKTMLEQRPATDTAALKAALKAREDDLVNSRAMLKTMTDREASLTEAHHALKRELAKSKEETSALKILGEQNGSLRNENETLRLSAEQAAHDLQAKTDELAAVQKMLDGLKQETAPKDQRIAELSQRVAVLQEAERSLKPKTQGMRPGDQDQVSQLEQRLSATTARLTEAEKEITRAALTIADLKEELADRQNPGSSSFIKVSPAPPHRVDEPSPTDRQILKLALDVTEKETLINSLRQELTAVRTSLESAENAMKNASDERAMSEVRAQAAQRMIEDRDSEIKRLTALLKLAEAKKIPPEKQVAELHLSLQQLLKKSNEAKEAIDQKTYAREAMLEDLKELKARLRAAQEVVEGLRRDLALPSAKTDDPIDCTEEDCGP